MAPQVPHAGPSMPHRDSCRGTSGSAGIASVCEARAVIVGVGIDVVGVARFAETLERTPGLAQRLFTIAERQRPIASQAARFAAKEALAKALGAPGGLISHDAGIASAVVVLEGAGTDTAAISPAAGGMP